MRRVRHVAGMAGAGMVIAGSLAVALTLVVITGTAVRALALGITAAEWRRTRKRGKA